MPIYMNYNGNEVPGDVSEDTHKDWIELTSFQWGVGRGISSPTGASADRESSAPSLREITVTKASDQASNKLLLEALKGKGASVQIDFCRTAQGKLAVYMTYALLDVMISAYSTSSGGDRPQESLSLNFTYITVTITP